MLVKEVELAQRLIKGQAHQSKINNIAVLVRTNNQARRAHEWLEKAGIASEINVGGTFFNSEAAKDFHALLEALLYPTDAKSVLNALATPFFDSDVPFDALIDFGGNDEQILAYLREAYGLEEQFEKRVEELRIKPAFAVLRTFLAENIEGRFYAQKYAELGAESVLTREMAEMEARKYMHNLNHLMNLLHRHFDSTNATLFAIHAWLGIHILINREEDEPRLIETGTEDVVDIVTVHKAKGLEYHTVILPFVEQPFDSDWNEILFDDKKETVGWKANLGEVSGENDFYRQLKDVEVDEIVKEETRLLYVALTRTRERLILFQPYYAKENTWANQLAMKQEAKSRI